MDARSIQRHLTPYSIKGRRATTIRHAFASALAPIEVYDEARLREAMSVLGQRDPNDLRCVYCHEPAETWDHLGALVKDSRPSGLGHTLGNLVPACKPCNSKRGNQPWEAWMRARKLPSTRISRIREYQVRYAVGERLVPHERLTDAQRTRLLSIQEEILALMQEADDILRSARTAVL